MPSFLCTYYPFTMANSNKKVDGFRIGGLGQNPSSRAKQGMRAKTPVRAKIRFFEHGRANSQEFRLRNPKKLRKNRNKSASANSQQHNKKAITNKYSHARTAAISFSRQYPHPGPSHYFLRQVSESFGRWWEATVHLAGLTGGTWLVTNAGRIVTWRGVTKTVGRYAGGRRDEESEPPITFMCSGPANTCLYPHTIIQQVVSPSSYVMGQTRSTSAKSLVTANSLVLGRPRR